MSSARTNLRQRLSLLARRAAGALFVGTDSLQLHPSVEHDLDGLAGAPPRLLSGWDYADLDDVQQWLDQRDAWLLARWRQATQERALLLEVQGDSAAAVALAGSWLTARPADEMALRLVMALHQRRGDHAAALAAFEQGTAVLQHELGVEPDADSCRLHAQSLAAQGTATPREPQALMLMRPPQLVGRGAELAALDAIVAAGRVAVLLGEPGSGKSRLLDAWRQSQPAPLWVGCRPGDEQVPYALVARLLQAALAADARAVATEAPDTVQRTLQHLLPACGPPPALPLQTHSVAPTVLWALARFGAECACTVLIDDLQFADPASLEQLPALLDAAATPTTPPLVWALALRSAEVPPVMQAWLAGAVGDSAQTLQLGPLDAAGVQTLLDTLGLPGPDARLWAGTLHRHTGGHPLYLLQTLMALSRQGGLSGARALATLGSAVPAAGGTLALVQARITRLGAQAQDLLNVAALAGQDFNLALATRVLDTSPLALADSWHALEQAHLMTGERIAHDLVGEAALRSVPTAAAAAWHALIAAHLAGSGGSLPRIAAHWRAAGRWPEAGRAFADAAAQIRLQLRQAEEAALLLQAADCQAAAGNADAEGEALFLLFKAQWARKHRAGIAEATNRLQALPATPRTAPWAQATRGITAFDDRPNDESLALMVGAQAQALALAVGDTALALWLKGWEVGSLSLLNRPHQVLEAVQRTLPLIDEMPSHAAACSALSQCGIALEVGGHVQQGLALLETAEARYRELGELMLTADSQTHQSVCHFHLGRVDEAARLLEAGCQAMADLNGGTAEPHTSDYYLARYWREQGRLGLALQHMLALLDLLDLLARLDADGNATLRALFGVEAGLAYVLLGQPHRARAHVEAPRGVAAASGRVDGLLLEAAMARAMGQPITPLLLRALPLLPDSWRPERWRWRVQLELSREMEPAAAIGMLNTNLGEADEQRIASALSPTRLMLLHAHQRAGDVAAAHQQALLLEASLAHSTAMTVYAGEYFLLMTQACEAAGDTASARRLLQRGLAWVERVRRDHVPAAFQDSFMQRNPTNRQLRALAQRLPA